MLDGICLLESVSLLTGSPNQWCGLVMQLHAEGKAMQCTCAQSTRRRLRGSACERVATIGNMCVPPLGRSAALMQRRMT